MSTPLSGQQGAQLSGPARAEYVRDLFARIVPRYDLFNSISTLGQDRRWRRMVVEQAALPVGGRGLDVATGTGAVAFALADRTPTAQVVGVDFCAPMIDAANAQAAGRRGHFSFQVGDALHLPFEDATFDCVTISFGIRNVTDILGAFSEMRRVLKPGGRLVCLELTRAQSRLVRIPFRLYFYRISPLIGRLLSGDKEAYTYLPHSLTNFPAATELARLMQRAGLREVRYRRLNFGTIAIHKGIR